MSDQSEVERAAILNSFHRTVVAWNRLAGERERGGLSESQGTEGERETQKRERGGGAHLLVATDACLPSQQMGEAPLGARSLINYDIPTKKEVYLRRISACLGHTPARPLSSHSGSIVINVVVGGEALALKHLEEQCGILVEEMPINIAELL